MSLEVGVNLVSGVGKMEFHFSAQTLGTVKTSRLKADVN